MLFSSVNELTVKNLVAKNNSATIENGGIMVKNCKKVLFEEFEFESNIA